MIKFFECWENFLCFIFVNYKLLFVDLCKLENSKILYVDGDWLILCKEKLMLLCDNMFNNEWYRV